MPKIDLPSAKGGTVEMQTAVIGPDINKLIIPPEAIESINKYADAWRNAQGQTNKAQNNLNEWLDKVGPKFDTAISGIQSIGDSISGIIQNNAQSKTKALDEEMAQRLAAVQGNKEAELAIHKEFEDRKAKIEKEAAKKRKAIALVQAVINTAQAVIKGLADSGPFGAIAAGIVGAAQIAVIASQSFAKGTFGAPGGPALVGEYGPEMVTLPRGARVTPANQTSTIMRNVLGSARQENQMQITTRVSGTDLVLVLDRVNKSNLKARGY